jgi:hypothetical protein
MPTEREALRKIFRERPELHAALRKAIEDGRLKDASEVDPNEEFTIVCGPDHGGVEGSKQAKCACGALVWMSPSTQELLKSREGLPTLIKCITCVMKETKKA